MSASRPRFGTTRHARYVTFWVRRSPHYSAVLPVWAVCQRCSAPVRRQYAIAHAQMATNRPTMAKPKLLRLIELTQSVTGSIQPRSSCGTVMSSIVPISSATATDNPVTVRL
jgi:hypothetical protein